MRFGEIISRSKFLTAFFYLMDKNSFGDEQRFVLSGVSNNMRSGLNIGNFRRNIHRIEKGLITKPMKPVFAESYILETVKQYISYSKKHQSNSTVQWAVGTLCRYFNVVEETSEIKKAEELFLSFIPQDSKVNSITGEGKVSSIFSFEDFHRLNIQRRSIRYYDDKKVPRDLVEKALNTALLAPSACNRQPFVFRIIDDQKKLKIASSLPNGAKVFADNIKMMVFIIGDLSNYFDERDKHLTYIDSSLVAMNFILALETLGLSSCIINWSDLPSKNQELKRFLGLKSWEHCVMTISVGYASDSGGIPSSLKKEVSQVLKYN